MEQVMQDYATQDKTMNPTVQQTWQEFLTERSISLCPTSLTSDYNQTTKWINRCPVTNLEEGWQVLTWVLGQKPVKAARRVAMYVKSLYKWWSRGGVEY